MFHGNPLPTFRYPLSAPAETPCTAPHWWCAERGFPFNRSGYAAQTGDLALPISMPEYTFLNLAYLLPFAYHYAKPKSKLTWLEEELNTIARAQDRWLSRANGRKSVSILMKMRCGSFVNALVVQVWYYYCCWSWSLGLLQILKQLVHGNLNAAEFW